jgi:hypothetical protein
MSIATLKTLTDQISSCLSLKVDRENGDEVSGILQEFILIQDTAAEAMALSNMVLADRVAKEYESAKYNGLSATDKRAVINGRAAQELYYVTKAERLSRSISHGIDGYRSILSDLKEQRRNHGI